MNQEQILTKLNDFKENIGQLFRKHADEDSDFIEQEYLSGMDNTVEDLPLTINRDPAPGVKFYTTENAEIANGAPKADGFGIDSFGDEDNDV